jgi:hypothetical protein
MEFNAKVNDFINFSITPRLLFQTILQNRSLPRDLLPPFQRFRKIGYTDITAESVVIFRVCNMGKEGNIKSPENAFFSTFALPGEYIHNLFVDSFEKDEVIFFFR